MRIWLWICKILLYKQAWRTPKTAEETTVNMPEATTVILTMNEERPLTKNLKLPCTSRAAMVWNMSIALGALKNVKNIGLAIDDVTVEDIVNGYREKTIKLMWSFVSRCGLTAFIDQLIFCKRSED